MSYFQLESNMAGTWKPGQYYFANDFRELLNFLQLNPGQRLQRVKRPEKSTRVLVFNMKKGLMQWVT